MVKECQYCGNEFEAQRTDAKYCSGTCKNNAYIARKTISVSDNATLNGTPNSNNMSHRRQNVQSSIPLSNIAVNKLLQSLGSNGDILHSLLLEKDNVGEAKSSITEYRIKLMFIERDLAEAQKKVEELTKENERLWEKVENADEPFVDRIMGFCTENPSVIMALIDKLGLGDVSASPSINKTQSVNNDSENKEG